MVPQVEEWVEWFNARYPENSLNRQKRLEEALISLNWLLDEEQQESILFVENISGDPATTARKTIESIVKKQTSNTALDHAYEMRTWVKNALAKNKPEEL